MPPLFFQLKEVYKLSLFNVNQTVASKARNTSTVPIKDKQFLIVTDSGDIFYDSDGTRVQLTDIIVLDTESQRLALTSPFEKFYFVKGSGALWRYNNSSWVKCLPVHSQIYSAPTEAQGISLTSAAVNTGYFLPLTIRPPS